MRVRGFLPALTNSLTLYMNSVCLFYRAYNFYAYKSEINEDNKGKSTKPVKGYKL